MLTTKSKFVLGVVLVGGLFLRSFAEVGDVQLDSVALARPDGNANDAVKGKRKLAVIRLGEKKQDLLQNYGKPDKTETFVSGVESLEFRHGPDLRLLVEIAPKTGQVMQIFYKKKTPFTGMQITELLDRNAEGSKWWAVRVVDDALQFQRLDGGFARSGKFGDEHQFAILSGSEVQGRNPTADAERQKLNESLKEIE